MSFEHPVPPRIGPPDAFAEWLLACCEFCGDQEDGNGGTLQLWTLRKSHPGLVVKSTYARATLEAAYKRARYGSTQVQPDPALGAIESP